MGHLPLGVCLDPPGRVRELLLASPNSWFPELPPSQPWSLNIVTAWFCGCLSPAPSPQCPYTHTLKHHTSTSPRRLHVCQHQSHPGHWCWRQTPEIRTLVPGNLHTPQAAQGVLKSARVPPLLLLGCALQEGRDCCSIHCCCPKCPEQRGPNSINIC